MAEGVVAECDPSVESQSEILTPDIVENASCRNTLMDYPNDNVVEWERHTHALIKFQEEDSTSVVPLSRVVRKGVMYQNQSCVVRWSNNKEYSGLLVISGSIAECSKKQDEIDLDSSDSDGANMLLPEKRMRQRKLLKIPTSKITLTHGDDDKQLQKKKECVPKRKKPNKMPNDENESVNKKKKRETKKKDIQVTAKKDSTKQGEFVFELGASPPRCHPSVTSTPKDDLESLDSVDVTEEQDGDKKLFITVYDDDEGDWHALPKHNISAHDSDTQDHILKEVTNIRAEIRVAHKEQIENLRDEIKTHMKNQIKDIREIIIQELTMLSKNEVLENVVAETSQLPIIASSPPPSNGSEESSASSLETTETPAVGNHEEVGYQELISASKLTELFVKSCSRRNLAVRMVRILFDEETRLKSNVNGRGKEKLDPEIIKYVKRKCFYYWPLSCKETEEEGWKLCVISIDENARSLKNKQRKGPVKTQ